MLQQSWGPVCGERRWKMADGTGIAIIGGGIMGVSLAFALTKMGVRDVTVIERKSLASGGSGRSGALLRQHYSNVPEATLAHLSLQTYANWGDIVGGDCGFEQTGLIATVATDGDNSPNIERMHHNVNMQNSIGIRSRVITAQELQELQPFARVDDLDVAAYEPESGFVDSVATTRSMAEAAKRAGATILEGCEVTGIVTDGDSVSGVATGQGLVSASTVVCAAGPWSLPLLAPLGVHVPMESQRVQVAVLTRPLDMPADGTLTYVDTAAGIFCRNFGPNRTLVGVGGGEFHDTVDPFAYDERLDSGFEETVIEYLARRMPPMRAAGFLQGYSGLYDMTPDAHPVIGPAPGIDGLYLALGFSGAGFKKGPAVGQCLAELIVNGAATTVDLEPFRLERFDTDAWRQPWSPNEYTFSTNFGHGF
jgi:sarcosine oxidase, subunit beta